MSPPFGRESRLFGLADLPLPGAGVLRLSLAIHPANCRVPAAGISGQRGQRKRGGSRPEANRPSGGVFSFGLLGDSVPPRDHRFTPQAAGAADELEVRGDSWPEACCLAGGWGLGVLLILLHVPSSARCAGLPPWTGSPSGGITAGYPACDLGGAGAPWGFFALMGHPHSGGVGRTSWRSSLRS